MKKLPYSKLQISNCCKTFSSEFVQGLKQEICTWFSIMQEDSKWTTDMNESMLQCQRRFAREGGCQFEFGQPCSAQSLSEKCATCGMVLSNLSHIFRVKSTHYMADGIRNIDLSLALYHCITLSYGSITCFDSPHIISHQDKFESPNEFKLNSCQLQSFVILPNL